MSKKPMDRRSLVELAHAEGQRTGPDPNIAAVGIGLKFVKGKPTLTASIQYYVHRKVGSDAEIRALKSEPVPREIEGYQTDILPLTIATRLACPGSHTPTGDRGSRKEDPLLGGTSTTVLGDFHSFPTGYGTLAGICFDAGSGDALALSNAHVYGQDIGNDVIQPWLPTSEYLEAAVKYLFCGGPLAHLFFWTAPSPLTGILTTLAAAAWTAVIASDVEDPSRWGQRTGPVPAASALTQREDIHLAAQPPRLPFPGRIWRSRAKWDYRRRTTAGDLTGSIEQDRANEHVLLGKRVFSDHDVYHAGDRVGICAQLWTPPEGSQSMTHAVAASGGQAERFVVATCFPLSDPGRSYRRILTPGLLCERVDIALEKSRQPACAKGFTPPVAGLDQVNMPYEAPPYRIYSEESTKVSDPTAPDNPSGLTTLRIPKSGLWVACPPSTHISVSVYHGGQPVRLQASSANGREVGVVQTTVLARTVQVLKLSGPEITRLRLDGGDGNGYVVMICVDKRWLDWGQEKVVSRYYHGELQLALSEKPGKWGVVVVAQSMDRTPTGGDPLRAARVLSGIAESANVAEVAECTCLVLFDHVFDVI